METKSDMHLYIKRGLIGWLQCMAFIRAYTMDANQISLWKPLVATLASIAC